MRPSREDEFEVSRKEKERLFKCRGTISVSKEVGINSVHCVDSAEDLGKKSVMQNNRKLI